MHKRTLYLISLLVLGVALVIALDITPWLRGGYGWRWPLERADFVRVLPLIAAVVVYLAGSFVLLRRTKRALSVQLWSVLGTVVLSVAVAHARDPQGDALYALFIRTASAFTTGPHWAATQVDWQAGEWRDWTQVMGRLGGHLGTSPPGLPMLYAGLNDAINVFPKLAATLREPLFPYQCHNYAMLDYTPAQWASTWFGVLMPLWAGLTVFPLVGVARRIMGGDARLVAVWWALTPGILAFGSSWSTFYPLVSVTVFWLLVRGLNPESGWHGAPLRTYAPFGWIFAAGVFTGAALFLNFAFLPLPGLCGFFVVFVLLSRARHALPLRQILRSLFIVGACFAVGMALPWLIFSLVGGQSFFAMLQASFEYHLDLDRPYWFWVGMHVWDWALWTGVGFTVLWLLGIYRQLRTGDAIYHVPNEDCRSPVGAPCQDAPPEHGKGVGTAYTLSNTSLALSLLLTVLIMTLSGTTQGESGRIWLFLSPFVLVVAWGNVPSVVGTQHGVPLPVGVLTVCHAILAIVLTANLAVIGTDFTHPPEAPSVAGVELVSVDATFAVGDTGEVFGLSGWHGTVEDDVVRLTLQWQPVQRMYAAYWFSAFLIASDGSTTEPVLWQPGEFNDMRYPTSCWQPGTGLEDQIVLPLLDGAAVGEWWISLAVFGDEAQPEGRLQVVLPDGTADVQVGLGPVQNEDG